MAFLDYTGLGHFLDKLKLLFLAKDQGSANAGKYMKVGNDGTLTPAQLDLPSDMTGASASAAGTHGLVPAPAIGDQDKYLKGDGTWGEVSASHAAFVETDVDILTTDWVAGTNVYTYTYTNSAILSDTLVDVFYKDGAEDVLQSKVSVSKAVGSVTLTVESVPTGTLPITIRLIQNTDSTVVAAASTTQAGIVQLSDSVSDTSTTKAATANAVKSVNDKLGTVPSGQTLQGQIDTVSSNLGTVPSGKTAQGQIDTLSSTVGTVPSGKTVQGQIDTLQDETVYYGTCSETAAATAQKAVTCTNFPTTLKAGQKLSVKFTNANTASNPTLKVNSLDAKSIVRYGSTVAKSGDWKAGEVVDFMFDGTNWVIIGGGIHDDVDSLNSKIEVTSLTKIGEYAIYYAKYGRIVTVQTDGWIPLTAPSSSQYVTVATLPSGYRPSYKIRFNSGTNGDTNMPEAEIGTNGNIKIWGYAGKTNRPEFAVSFFV